MKLILLFLLIIPVVSADIKVYDDLNESRINETLSYFEIPDYIHTVRFFNRTRDYCGFYWFGGMIDININKECTNYDFSWIISHELTHGYFFNEMSSREQHSYCRSVGMKGRNCWEQFVLSQ